MWLSWQKWLLANDFEHKEERTEKCVKLVCCLGMSTNITATYNSELSLLDVDNPPVSWIISDIKRYQDRSKIGLDESECDIRFMLKTQVGPFKLASFISVSICGAMWSFPVVKVCLPL